MVSLCTILTQGVYHIKGEGEREWWVRGRDEWRDNIPLTSLSFGFVAIVIVGGGNNGDKTLVLARVATCER